MERHQAGPPTLLSSNDAVDVTLLSTHQNTIHALTATTPSSLETTHQIHELVHRMRDVLLFARLYTAAVQREPRILHLLLHDAMMCAKRSTRIDGDGEDTHGGDERERNENSRDSVRTTSGTSSGVGAGGVAITEKRSSEGKKLTSQHSSSAPRNSGTNSTPAPSGTTPGHFGAASFGAALVEVKSRQDLLREQGISAVRAVLRAFVIDQRVLLRQCEETTTAVSAAGSSSRSVPLLPATFFQSSFAARQLYEDMQILSRSLLIPLDLLRYRQEWLLIHEDMSITLKDMLLHLRATALRTSNARYRSRGSGGVGRDATGERESEKEECERERVALEADVGGYALSLWSDLTNVLAAAVRQRHRIFGVDGPHTRVLVMGDDTRTTNSRASGGKESGTTSNAMDWQQDWARISFGPLAPHSIAHTTSQHFAIRRPLLPVLLHSLRVRQQMSGSNPASPSSLSSLPFFDACVDSEAYSVPYLSPQSYTAIQKSGQLKKKAVGGKGKLQKGGASGETAKQAQAKEKEEEWQALTLADDVWSVAVITLEVMLSSMDLNTIASPQPRRNGNDATNNNNNSNSTDDNHHNSSLLFSVLDSSSIFVANPSDSFFASLCAWRRWRMKVVAVGKRTDGETAVGGDSLHAPKNYGASASTCIGVLAESDAKFLYSVLHALQVEYSEQSSTITRRRRQQQQQREDENDDADYDDEERKHFFPAQSDAEENIASNSSNNNNNNQQQFIREGSGPSSKDSSGDDGIKETGERRVSMKEQGEVEEGAKATAPKFVARALLRFLRANFPSSDALHSVMSVGLLWRREDRYRAFFSDQGMGEWYADEIARSQLNDSTAAKKEAVAVERDTQLPMRKLQAALAALQTPLLPLLGNLTPSVPQDTAMRDLIHLVVAASSADDSATTTTSKMGDREVFVEQRAKAGDGNRPAQDGGEGEATAGAAHHAGGLATAAASSTRHSGGITSFLHTFREWRKLIERVMLLEGGGGGNGGSEAKSRAVFSEMVNLVQRVAQSSSAAAPVRDTGGRAGASKSSNASPSSGTTPAVPTSGSSGAKLVNRRIPRASVPPAAAAPTVQPRHNREILIVPMLRELFGRQLLCSIRTHCQPYTASSHAAAVLLLSPSSGNLTIPHATFELPQVVAVLRADILYFTRHLTATSTSASMSATSTNPRALDSLVGGPVQNSRRLQATRQPSSGPSSNASAAGRDRQKHGEARQYASAFPPDYEARLQLSREIRKPLGVVRALDLNGEAQHQLVARLRKLFVILNARSAACQGSPESCTLSSSATIVREFMWTAAVEELQKRRLRSSKSPRRSPGGGGGPRTQRMRRDVITACATAAIPDTLRGLVWEQLLQLPDRYTREQVLMKSVDPSRRLNCDRQIAVDIPRCHQYSPLFSSVEGHTKLRRVIKTWLLLHPSLTYWQGLDSVCAALLSASYHDEALAVAQMAALTTFFIPHYYCSQTQSRADAPDSPAPPSAFESPVFPLFHPSLSSPSTVVYPQQGRMEDRLRHFVMVLTYCDPQLAHHLFVEVECRPELFAISWFLTLFAHNLPLKKVHLVWNALFYLSSFSVDSNSSSSSSTSSNRAAGCMNLPIVAAPPASVIVCVACAVVMQKRAALLGGDLVSCLATLACIHDINAVRLPHTTAKLLVTLPESILTPSFLSSSTTEGSAGYSAGNTVASTAAATSRTSFNWSLYTSPVALLLPSDLLHAYESVHAVARAAPSARHTPKQGNLRHDDFDWTAQGVCVVDLRSEEERRTAVPGQTTHILAALAVSTLIAGTTASLDMQEVEELLNTIRRNPCAYSIPPARLLHAVHFRGGDRRKRNTPASGKRRGDEDGADTSQGRRESKTRLLGRGEIESPLLNGGGSDDASGSMFELSTLQYARSSIVSRHDSGAIHGGFASASAIGGRKAFPSAQEGDDDCDSNSSGDEYYDENGDERDQEEEEEDLRLVSEMNDYNPLTVVATSAAAAAAGGGGGGESTAPANNSSGAAMVASRNTLAGGAEGDASIGGAKDNLFPDFTAPHRSTADLDKQHLPWAPHVVLVVPGAAVQQRLGARRFEERVTRLCETLVAAGLPKVSLLAGGFAALQQAAPQLIVKVDE